MVDIGLYKRKTIMLSVDSKYTLAQLEALVPLDVEYYCYRLCDYQINQFVITSNEFYFDKFCFARFVANSQAYFTKSKFGICGPTAKIYSFTNDFTQNFIQSRNIIQLKAKP